MRDEQRRALEYFAERGTRAPVAEIRRRVAEAFNAFEALVGDVADARAAAAPGAGEWSPHEVVDHLVETHRPSIVELRGLLEGRRPAGPPIPASLRSPQPFARGWSALRADLGALHRETLDVLAGARDDLPLVARAPIVMVVNAREPDGRVVPLHWIEELDWKAYAVVFRLHVLDHLGQVRRALQATRPRA